MKTELSNFHKLLFLLLGISILLIALFYNEFLISYFDPSPPLREMTIKKIRNAQIYLLLIGTLFMILAESVKKLPRFKQFLCEDYIEKILLLVISVSIPIVLLEITLRPLIIVDKPTTIFMRDNLLGWKFKPNTHDIWGKVPVRINGKGLRGPELPYAKPKNTKRILYLGDSVTFGYLLDSYEKTFPYLIDSILNEKSSFNIETINAGIDGYSPLGFLYFKNRGD